MEGIILAFIGIVEAVITSLITFILTRRKYKAEVKGSEIENDGHQIDNSHNTLDFYIKLVDDNKKKLDELQVENQYLRQEMAEMRTVVFGMLSQICTDMMCQNRKFDQASCPYYDKVFKLQTDINNEK